jgi:hypothetical protein
MCKIELLSNLSVLTVISGIRRDFDEIWALVEYYAVSSGNPLLTFRGNLSFPSSRIKKSMHKAFFVDFLTLEYGTDTLSRNVGKGLPPHAA